MQITERNDGETSTVERDPGDMSTGERIGRGKTSLRKIARHSRKQEKGKYSVVGKAVDTDIKGTGTGNGGGGNGVGVRGSSSSMPRVLR